MTIEREDISNIFNYRIFFIQNFFSFSFFFIFKEKFIQYSKNLNDRDEVFISQKQEEEEEKDEQVLVPSRKIKIKNFSFQSIMDEG